MNELYVGVLMSYETIARDKKELSQFVLDLCGFTLDEAGYDSKTYAFYLSIALRRQMHSEIWSTLCATVSKDNPLSWKPETVHQIQQLAQTIVSEVTQMNEDCWAVKLLKTSYFNHLDKRAKAVNTLFELLMLKITKHYPISL